MTHVLIPARNEAHCVGRLLESLSSATVEPIVIANGCTDDTATIARGFGATVLELDEPGKLPALQEGVRHITDTGQPADEPMLFTDADSWPVFPKSWAASLSQGLGQGGLALAVGPLVYRQGHSESSNIARSFVNNGRQIAGAAGLRKQAWPGANMAVRFAKAKHVDAFLSLDHYWPGADCVIADLVLLMGGTRRLFARPTAAVYTDSRYAPNFFRRLFMPLHERRAESIISYGKRGANGAVPYLAGSLAMSDISGDLEPSQ